MELQHSGSIRERRGPPLEDASGAVVMVHGRGDSARGIISLAEHLVAPGVSFVAPEATGNSWYPHSFLAPLSANEPWLSSALAAIGESVEEVEANGIARDQVVLLGFSQGACLVSEFAARKGGRFGGIVALSGGLIGPPGTPRDYGTDLRGTRVFLGCSDVDPHIPVERVHETEEALTALGAAVEKRIYPGMGHTINQDEVGYVIDLLRALG